MHLAGARVSQGFQPPQFPSPTHPTPVALYEGALRPRTPFHSALLTWQQNLRMAQESLSLLRGLLTDSVIGAGKMIIFPIKVIKPIKLVNLSGADALNELQ